MAKRQRTAQAGLTRKQVSRAQRENQLQQVVLYSVIGVAVAVALVIGFGVANQFYFIPNKAVATVNGDPITVAKFQVHAQYEFHQYVQYYQQLLGSALPEGLGPEYFGEMTLENMIDDKIVEQKAAEMGIVVTDEEVAEQLELAFGYDAGEPEPTSTERPTSTSTPPGPTEGPTVTSTFVYTQTPSPMPTLEEGVTPTATATVTPTPTITPTPEHTPTVTATSTPWPTSEPITEEQYNEQLTEELSLGAEQFGLTEDEMRILYLDYIYTNMLKEQLIEALDFDVAQTKTLVHASHILVETHEEALAALERYEAGEDFEVLAAELSIDTANAYKGGDLGWNTPDTFVPAFAEAVKNRPIGEVGDPVETEFGWHLIKVYDRQEVPTTPQEQDSERQTLFSELQTEWRDEADVVIHDDVWKKYMPDLGLGAAQPAIPAGY